MRAKIFPIGRMVMDLEIIIVSIDCYTEVRSEKLIIFVTVLLILLIHLTDKLDYMEDDLN